MTEDFDWTFAYGSNMDLDDLKRFFDENGFEDAVIEAVEPAYLCDYKLIWNYYSTSRRAGAANVESCSGRDLPGLALRVDKKALQAIDRKEGHPSFYSRGEERHKLKLFNGKEVEGWVYIALPTRTKDNVVPPSKEYREFLIKAAKRYGFPEWYIKELEETPVAALT
jgi:hypothetical protein